MTDAKYVIVGGSKGIGRAMVERLASDGQQVVVMSRTAGDVASLSGVEHISVDVTADEITKDMLPENIAGLAYCPGSLNLKSFRGLDADTFRQDFEVNVVGAVKVIQAALTGLKSAGSASILMFSTVAVSQGLRSHATIASAKGAVEGLAKTLACELAPKVRVNVIAPALTDTPLTGCFFENPAKAKSLGEMYALKRTGTVDDIAEMGCLLLSEKSSWITGQVIGVDGGMSTVR